METPLRHFLHIFLREFLGFWTSRTLQSALGYARSGAQVNPSTMVSFLLFLEDFTADCWTVWFRRYRKENFNDESLPPGKWTRRESKQNWVRAISFLPRRANFLLCRESCTPSQFRLERQLVRDTQPQTPVPVTSHQGRQRRNNGAVRLWQYLDQAKGTCGRCIKSWGGGSQRARPRLEGLAVYVTRVVLGDMRNGELVP